MNHKNQLTASATKSSLASQPAVNVITKTRCSLMNAALVSVSGKGPINQRAKASLHVALSV